MDLISDVFGILKTGILSVYNMAVQGLQSVSPAGLYLLIALLSISLVWRYLVSPLFK